MIDTFLFDLDGTLLPLKWEIFEKEYFFALGSKLSGHFEPGSLTKYIWKSTMKMIENTGGKKTNEEVFYQDFAESTGKDVKLLSPIFNEFYQKEFNQLGRLARVEPNAVNSVNLLYERGYELVIATNPVFPLTAIKARIRWAGLDEKKFRFITCFEDMHYCKPNTEYYGEILQRLNKKPEECLMVGNDVEEDLAASKLGIKVFLILDYIINRNNLPLPSDYIGTYDDFYKFVYEMFPPLDNSVRNCHINNFEY